MCRMLKQPLYRHPADDIFINVSCLSHPPDPLTAQMQERVVFQPGA
jgi:hypothetical protein